MATLEKVDSKDIKLEAVKAAPVTVAPRERDPQRDKAIELAVSTIEKQFGKGSIMRLGEETAPPEVKVVPTGSLGLDIALGIGGLPPRPLLRGYRPGASGKKTPAPPLVPQAPKAGG